jgi:hypothetical protein
MLKFIFLGFSRYVYSIAINVSHVKPKSYFGPFNFPAGANASGYESYV